MIGHEVFASVILRTTISISIISELPKRQMDVIDRFPEDVKRIVKVIIKIIQKVMPGLDKIIIKMSEEVEVDLVVVGDKVQVSEKTELFVVEFLLL